MIVCVHVPLKSGSTLERTKMYPFGYDLRFSSITSNLVFLIEWLLWAPCHYVLIINFNLIVSPVKVRLNKYIFIDVCLKVSK